MLSIPFFTQRSSSFSKNQLASLLCLKFRLFLLPLQSSVVGVGNDVAVFGGNDVTGDGVVGVIIS